MSKIAQKEFHSLANIFPMMSETEMLSLQSDIKKNGLNEPVWLFEDKIIDGRNRYLACLAVGVEPKFREYEGKEIDLVSFVISLNLHRRHLNTGQKACLAVDVLPMLEEQAKEIKKQKISASRKGEIAILKTNKKSRDVAGEMFAVSGKYVSNAKKIKDNSIKLFELVKNGKTSLSLALKELDKLSEKVVILPPTDDSNSNEINVFSKSDSLKLKELVINGMPEKNAINYILSKKRKPREIKTISNSIKKIEFRVDENEKVELQILAKQQNMTLSELMRSLIKNLSH